MWQHELNILSDFSVTQPHAAYAAFVHGVVSKWNYLARCVPDIQDLFLPLEEVIQTKFLPSLTGQCSFNVTDRCLLSLPTRLGGLGVIDPSKYLAYQFSSSVRVAAPLVELILQQSTTYSANVNASQLAAKKLAVDAHNHELLTCLNTLLPHLCPRL